MALTKVTYSMIVGAPANVKDFGAVGNGTADDTAAIAAACAASSVVYFPAGTYAVRTVTINNSCTLFGDGIGNTVITRVAAFASEDSDLIQFNGTDANVGTTMLDFVSVEGITFDFSAHTFNGADTHSCLRIYLCDNITVDNCSFFRGPFHGVKINGALNVRLTNNTFTECGFDGIGIGGSGGLPGAPQYTEKVVIDSNIFDNIFNGSNIQVFVDKSIVSNNIFKKSTITFGQPCNKVVVSGNIVDLTNTYGYTNSDQNDGVFIEGDTDVVITGNVIREAGGNGIYVLGSEVFTPSPPTTTQLPIRRVLIDGNIIYAAVERGIQIKGSSFDGLQIGSTITISNNQIDASGNDGVVLLTTDNFKIADNTISNSFLNGVSVSASKNGLISNNKITNSGQISANSYYGVKMDQNTFNVDFHNNQIFDTSGVWTTRFAFLDDTLNNSVRSNIKSWNNRLIGISGSGAPNGIPALGTFNIGDQTQNFDPDPTEYMGWVCTTAGTFGTLVGITGSTASGQFTLVVNTTTGLEVGDYITIVGVTGIKRITSIVGTTVLLDLACDATTAGAAVAYSTPVFKGFGLIQT